MRQGTKLLALALSAALAFAGCAAPADVFSGKKGAESSETSTAEASASEAPELDESELEEKTTEKYNAYVRLNNFMNDRLTTVVNSYFRRVTPQEEFQMLSGQTDFWCNSLSDSDLKILDTAAGVSKAEPSMAEVDAAFEKMEVSMRPMMETFIEIYNYGELKTYKDDDYAGAAELHAKLWPLYNTYIEAEMEYIDAVDVMSAEQQKKDLELFKELGYDAHYTYSCLIAKGQEIQSAIYEQEISDENILELDVEALQPLYAEFVQLVTDSIAVTSEQVQKEGGYMSPLLSTNIKDAKVSLTNIFERVKNQKPLQGHEINSAFPASGTISEFEEKMGDIVDGYNSTWR